jgi:hypothetical protein
MNRVPPDFARHSILEVWQRAQCASVLNSFVTDRRFTLYFSTSQLPCLNSNQSHVLCMGVQTLLHRRSLSVMTMKSAWARRESSISHVNLTGDRNWTLISAMLETILRHANASWPPWATLQRHYRHVGVTQLRGTDDGTATRDG